MKIYACLSCFLLLLCTTTYTQTVKTNFAKVNMNDSYKYISINQIKMWVSNNGNGSHDPQNDASGFYWPGGPLAVKSSIFADGLIWGGSVGGEIRVNGNTYRQGLQAGKILPNGIPDDPSLSKYRVYKILNGWENLPPGPVRDEYELDYNEWPVEDGAPWIDINNDGVYTPGIDKPEFVGDETLWYVSNDMDPSRSTYTYGSMPIGLEIQTTAYAFDLSNYLADVVFKKYKIINKSSSVIDDFYICYWADDDLGNANDDYSGCDPYFHLGYTYNGDNNDEGGINSYGTPPPAIGHMFVQGPITPALPNDSAYFNNEWRKGFKNLPMTSFAFYISGNASYVDPQLGTLAGTAQFYQYMQGLIWNGSPYLDPNNGNVTVFPLSGNPVSSIGWCEGTGWPGGPSPGDRRSVINSGPVTLAVGDTQEVVIAIFMAIGTNNINSVSKLKERAQQIQDYYGAFVPNIVSVKEEKRQSLNDFRLYQNYPNPFNPSTKIRYTIPDVGIGLQNIHLRIFDVLGNEIKTLINKEQAPGRYEIEFSANNELTSGVYFYQIISGNFIQTHKMILMK